MICLKLGWKNSFFLYPTKLFPIEDIDSLNSNEEKFVTFHFLVEVLGACVIGKKIVTQFLFLRGKLSTEKKLFKFELTRAILLKNIRPGLSSH